MNKFLFVANIMIIILFSAKANGQVTDHSFHHINIAMNDSLPHITVHINKDTNNATSDLITSSKGFKVYKLSPDNMPCLVPDTLAFDKMSIYRKNNDNMPNVIPEREIIP